MIKEWKRNCPKCNKELIYYSRRGYWYGNKNNTMCRGCTRIVRGLSYPSRRGCYLTKEHKKKIAISATWRHKIYGHPMQGKRHSAESKWKIQQHSAGMTGKKHSKSTRLKIRNSKLGKPGPKMSPDGLRRLRIKRINEISNAKYNGGQIMPSYNVISCDFFKNINKKFGWNGKYALNGGEYHVKDLGYFVDYYEPKLNLVIEWDEKSHYDINGKLKEKDKFREQEIKSNLKCYFIRIKEREFNEELTTKNIYEIIKNKQKIF